MRELRLPIPQPPPPREKKEAKKEKPKRGVIVIDLSTGEEVDETSD